ncbi:MULTISPECIES: tRNA pseudouridine(38-40) synthase TruA [unclassified Polaribacter]|uniref:tRNA pseudouridine(38-40) synthase TruA n=1 Tax=unclassified Polaribacter TaxID=196858 RepID=UPI0011BDA0A9|nr:MULTISPECIES: tRNA pseudouridine(38-40) synthase TruA [unclassified Polaribacter]TXD51417.1 tRNA pseudouridine(38-40) synthase TruA [Polaribacter sp. IC063]TXD57255.1 tRNA pseudouridine(38-40) synthase TruA [Polaribacter sp. IC066]
MKYSKSYLIHLQFLGFRFSGWQKQTNAKTLHEMVDKSLSYVFEHSNFKTLGIGRTDAKVSANSFYMQLFLNEDVEESNFMTSLNSNLPADFRGISIKEVATNFNIIQASKIKEYHYYFSFGEKNHPFSAPFIVGLLVDLDIDTMIKAARLFTGEHYFHKYCTKPSADTIFKRTIDSCEIVENDILTANFFPEKSYVLKVRGSGFLRYQIRLMMATLFEVGKGDLDLQFMEASLKEDNDKMFLRNIAPSSGLQLFDIELVL